MDFERFTHSIFVIKDELACTYLQPFFLKTDDEAVRIFTHQINTIDLWKENSSDFTLWKIGEYNEDNAKIAPTNNPIKIISGHTVLRREKYDLQSAGTSSTEA